LLRAQGKRKSGTFGYTLQIIEQGEKDNQDLGVMLILMAMTKSIGVTSHFMHFLTPSNSRLPRPPALKCYVGVRHQHHLAAAARTVPFTITLVKKDFVP
jgi:hypothetical protein